MVQLEHFMQWLTYAIDRVGPGYYGNSERVYCYELYHFLRVAMFHHSKEVEPIENVLLHSEIVKLMPSGDQMNRWDIHPLDGQRSPDFILHQPETFDYQLVAMEVKTGPGLRYDAFIDDIEKLNQLRENFAYQGVIFHTIELSIDLLKNRVARALDAGVLPQDPVIMVIKERYESQIIITDTDEVLKL